VLEIGAKKGKKIERDVDKVLLCRFSNFLERVYADFKSDKVTKYWNLESGS